MGPLVATRCNPQIRGFDERLRAAGKVNKVALTACMRTLLTMLNAMLKHRTPWQPQAIQNEKSYQAPLTIKTVATFVPRFGYQWRLKRGVDMTSNVKSGLPMFLDFLRPLVRRPSAEPGPGRNDG